MNKLINEATAATKYSHDTRYDKVGGMAVRQAMIDGLTLLIDGEAPEAGSLEAVAAECIMTELRDRLAKTMMKDPRVRGVGGMSV